MKATAVQNKLKYFRYNKAKLGAKPGSIFIPKDALPTRVFEFRFHADFLEELEPVEVAEARSRPAPTATFTRWIDLKTCLIGIRCNRTGTAPHITARAYVEVSFRLPYSCLNFRTSGHKRFVE